MNNKKELSEAGKEEIALALILLKDFKCDGKFNIEISTNIIKLAQYLDVEEQFNKMLAKLPPMKIEPRYK